MFRTVGGALRTCIYVLRNTFVTSDWLTGVKQVIKSTQSGRAVRRIREREKERTLDLNVR